MQNLLHDLEEILKKKKLFVSDDGILLKNKVVEAGLKLDPKLIQLLLKNKSTKKAFFEKIDDIFVFDKIKFQQFVSNKEFLADSYTRFAQKIGLSDGGDNYLVKSENVVLNWPYKDCILEGGMSTAEKGRDEVFYNMILAPDEITRLTDKKVLSNFEKWDEESCKTGKAKKVTEIKDSNNLLIKGNNLLALHCLKERYEGKVKLIYIDPPYNTGSDDFRYNDNFNHSSWLTFMKNRLEVARRLLRDDGLIFVQCDDNEHAYLKVLMDEIFGSKNFLNSIVWKRKFGNANETKKLGAAYDNILLFSKSDNYSINIIKERNSKHVKEYIKKRFNRKVESGKHKGRIWMPYPLANPGKPTESLIYEYKGYSPPPKGWRMVKKKLEKLDKDERLYFPEKKSQRIQEKIFLDEYEGQPIDSLWIDIFVINSQSSEAYDFDGQKPEDLLKRIISMATQEGDIILDFFSGTGTTLATAHKMKRQWLGIEQLDYIKNLPELRLKNVINGAEEGISKKINWKGGGDFIYCELKEWNQKFVEEIKNARDETALEKVRKAMEKIVFYRYEIDFKNFESKDYDPLSINDKKRALLAFLDANHLYVNYSECDDKQYKISQEEKELTNKFYENKR